MSSGEDKLKGKTNEAVGSIKKGVGGATGNAELEREGRNQQLKGDAQQLKGDVKDSVKRGIDRA